MVKCLSVFVFRLLRFVLSRSYGFHLKGAENLPPHGPYIAIITDHSPISILCNVVFCATRLLPALLERKVLFFANEELWGFRYFRFVFTRFVLGFPLLPHSGGLYALRLLDALAHLKAGGIVLINPEGDMSRDGHPAPVRGGAAWLGLHSAAPLVPVIVSASTYDLWPQWRKVPSLHGRIVQQVGTPFRLIDSPMKRVSRADVAAANLRIREEIDHLAYGPEGRAGWADPPVGFDATEAHGGRPVRLWPARGTTRPGRSHGRARGGIPLLLWRCPVCGTNDALVHARGWFRVPALRCRVCGTLWTVARRPGSDFRLRVVDGPREMVGLDMALSSWYDEMKRDFTPVADPALDADLPAEEAAFLVARGVRLLAHRSSPLFDGWARSEPPRAESPERLLPGDWAGLGKGELLLTNRRLVWKGSQRNLDFWWPSVRAVSLRLYSRLGVNYGATPYRFVLSRDSGLKWLTYAGTLAVQVAAQQGRPLTVSPF